MFTFKEVAEKALQNRCNTKKYRNDKSFKRWEQVVKTHLLPFLANKDISEIDSDTVVDVLKDLWETKPPTASLVRAVLDYIIGYAIHKKWRDANYNPAKWKDTLMFDLPPISDIHEIKHRKGMTVGDAQRLMPVLIESKNMGDKATAFGILTACRSSEYTQAKWEEIDFNNRIFSIPVSRCKVKRTTPFRVPLSSQAINLLKKIKETSNSEYVFFSKITRKAISPYCPLQVMKKRVSKEITAHGSRSTFSSWCAETGKDRVLREMCLMHVIGNRVENTYQRSEILNKRRLLMQEWADAIFHE